MALVLWPLGGYVDYITCVMAMYLRTSYYISLASGRYLLKLLLNSMNGGLTKG
jgi:hypothetical protein